eukprot:6177819-Pleurochrysis_carterae.AAC.4
MDIPQAMKEFNVAVLGGEPERKMRRAYMRREAPGCAEFRRIDGSDAERCVLRGVSFATSDGPIVSCVANAMAWHAITILRHAAG